MLQLATIKKIGSGGFGIVTLVQDMITGNQFAKKTFHPSNIEDKQLEENVKRRFKKEVKILSHMQHRNIMPIVEYDVDSDPPSYVMPLCEPISIDTIKAWKSVGNIEEMTKFFLDICAGVEEMHSYEIFHRDLKPLNVLRLGDGYVVSDFGLVSYSETQVTALTQTGMGVMSGNYTAPEITYDLKNGSRASDIYSLGCILHDFFGISDVRFPCQHVVEPNTIMGDIIDICTNTNPRARFQNVKDLRESVVEILNEYNFSNEPLRQQSLPIVNDYLKYLLETPVYEEVTIDSMLRYLENLDTEDSIYLFYRDITGDMINKLKGFDKQFRDFAFLYSEWAMKNEHAFARCDVIASNLEQIYENNSDIALRAKILLSLLIMGASHNRWYVEEKFMKHAKRMDEALAKRFILECRVIGRNVNASLAHLEHSINVSKNQLPLAVANYFNGV